MTPALCPICSRTLPADTLYAPFCSDRCRLIDLGRWLGETYRVPEEPDSDPVTPDDDE